MSISDKGRSELQDCVLREHGFLRGTTSLKILRFLFSKAGQKASASRNVQSSDRSDGEAQSFVIQVDVESAMVRFGPNGVGKV